MKKRRPFVSLGMNEWHNNDYCSNCAGEMVTTPIPLPPLAAGEKKRKNEHTHSTFLSDFVDLTKANTETAAIGSSSEL